jgi:DMSO/TMAO reductase YedYZ molybdopterin-dependent catalytic subunit
MLGFVMQRIDERSLVVAAKPDLVLLDTPELNAETPAHLLDDDITPIARLFARNTGAMPAFSVADIQNWTLTIDGCVHVPRTWTLVQLRSEFEIISETAVIECAGNGRAFFPDPAGTVLWRHGAVGCVRWTGVRLRDLLETCGLQPAAVYTGHHSPDLYLDGSGPAISRGLPIGKATAPKTLLAFELNGEPLPALHGGPLRLVAPGYPGAAFHKWLTRIEVRDREHDGERMLDGHYRMPRNPLRYGERFDQNEFEIITDMPVKSLITAPRDDFSHPAGEPLHIRGHAWSGHVPVAKVELSFDGGASWHDTALGPLPGRFAWRRFHFTLANPPHGAIEIAARASDARGAMQPMQSAPWNPRGYLNNMVHRVRGRIG